MSGGGHRGAAGLVAGGLLLALAGAGAAWRAWPNDLTLRLLSRDGGWQRATVEEGARSTAELTRRAALRAGSPVALVRGAEILTGLSQVVGDAAATAGLAAEARTMALAATRLSPTRAEAHAAAALAALAAGAPDEEVTRQVQAAAALDPGRSGLRRRLGYLELQRGRGQEAAVHLRAALGGDPEIAGAVYSVLEAAGSALSAAEVTPDHPRALAALAAWLQAAGESAGAEDAYRRGVSAAADEPFAALPAGHVDSLWQAERRLYRFLMSRGRYLEAVDLARDRAQSPATGLEPSLQAADLFDLGNALLAAEQPADAVAPLQSAAALQPEHIPYADVLARALAAAGRPGEAAAAWGRALALPRAVEADRRREVPMRIARARALAEAGERRAALEEVRRVLMARPDEAGARALAAELSYD